MATVRKGQWPGKLSREEFRRRYRENFYDPAFADATGAIAQLEQIAWDAYSHGRKSPVTREAGAGFADPGYKLSVEWSETRLRLQRAEAEQKSPSTRSRALVVCASARDDGSCPGEMSKTFRLAGVVREVLGAEGIEADFLDLSLLTSEYGRRIHPCKGCVSTAMPLCHWPCSCYPNHALGQVQDWMAEIYEKWVTAHGIVICTPVYWYQAPSPLKLMIDRMVCADGGNPDPTSTAGKNPAKAKEIELAGWDYPKHLQGRVYGLVVHGDAAGIGETRRALSDWLDWMGLIDAGTQARLDRYIGYYKPYATSHDDLDADEAMREEVGNVARAVSSAIAELRAGRLSHPDAGLESPRAK
ncbi:MAG TPA: flavodoxin family protein [Burkholderiales bacterium]|nr:flavodoxin family protein [Burkholderiales bacterium]